MLPREGEMGRERRGGEIESFIDDAIKRRAFRNVYNCCNIYIVVQRTWFSHPTDASTGTKTNT